MRPSLFSGFVAEVVFDFQKGENLFVFRIKGKIITSWGETGESLFRGEVVE